MEVAEVESLRRFVVEHQIYHGLNKSRRQQQKAHLQRLARRSGKNDPMECDASDVRAYLASLLEDDLNPNTVASYLGMIRPFFTWAFQAGLYPADELMRIRLVPLPKGSGAYKPNPYSPKELAKFWDDLEAKFPRDPRFEYWLRRWFNDSSRWRRLADHVERVQTEAIISLMLDLGLRRMEVFSLEIEEMHPDNAGVVVRQRGDRESNKDRGRVVPFTVCSREKIHEWLELRAMLGISHPRPWIRASKFEALSRVGEPMAIGPFTRLIGRIGDGNYTYHRFRHTCATLWTRSGMRIEKVQRLLGHKRLQQTLAYAELDQADLEASVHGFESKFEQLTRRHNR